jgi:hypothetical protein
VRLNNDRRLRLASKAKGLGRKLLAKVATIVTPKTLLAWHLKLIAEILGQLMFQATTTILDRWRKEGWRRGPESNR